MLLIRGRRRCLPSWLIFAYAVTALMTLAGVTFIKAEGVGVSANSRVMGKAVSRGDVFGAFPAEEIEFDLLALGMMANRAFAAMALRAGRGGRSRRVGGWPSAAF